jgi:hypothetical protein
MKSSATLALLVGLLVGSVLTYFTIRTTESKKTESVSIAEESEIKSSNEISKPEDGKLSTSKSPVEASECSRPITSDQKVPDILTCLDHLKPSDMEAWKANWQKRVADFLASNDSFWNSKGHHGFDSQIFSSIQGKYVGSWLVAGSKDLKADLNIELKSDVSGVVELTLIQTSNDVEKNISANCMAQMIPRKDLGVDEKNNAVNVLFYNCHPGMLGSMYSEFAFKLPIGMMKGQLQHLEVFGLNEYFDWKSVGFLDLTKK